MILEDLKEVIHGQLLPPAILLKDGEHSSQNVSNVTATTDVSGQGAISDSHED